MDYNNFTHQGDSGYPIDQRESHWQPALRPDVLIPEPDHNSIGTLPNHSTTDTIEVEAQTEGSDYPPLSTKGNEWYQDPTSVEEEEKWDPAWGFKRADSTHLLDGASRSPSFPMIESPSAMFIEDKLLPSSQAEEIARADMEETTKGTALSAFEEEVITESTMQNVLRAAHEETIETSDSILTERGSQERFQEGLPLMQSEDTKELPATGQISQESNPFATENIEEETSFFSQLKDEPEAEPVSQLQNEAAPRLDRKTTTDVLNAMTFEDGGADSPPLVTRPEETPVGDALEAFKQLEDPDAMWAAALDDDEFLVEDADDLLPDSDAEPGSPSSFSALLQEGTGSNTLAVEDTVGKSSQFVPDMSSRPDMPRQSSNPYAPHQPSSSSELAQLSPRTHNNIGFTRPGLPPMKSFQSQLKTQDESSSAASFVDKSKGGYQSPYDLPTDLAPKRRPQSQRAPPTVKNVAPPPRSSSITSEKQLQPAFSPTGPPPTQFPPSPPVQYTSSPARRISNAPLPNSISGNKSASQSFFEELPVVQRTRPSPAPSRYTPSLSNTVGPPPQFPVQSPPVLPSSPPKAQESQMQFQLRPPERIDPYANVPLQAAAIPVPGPASNRYSPAPSASLNGARSTPPTRYSPAPPPSTVPQGGRYASQPVQSGPPPMNNASFQPRTSSPLAHNRTLVDEQTKRSMTPVSVTRPAPPAATMPSPSRNPVSLPQTTPTTARYSPARGVEPSIQSVPAPPRRSQTQSPGQQAPKSVFAARPHMQVNRPASAYGQISTSTAAPMTMHASPPTYSAGRGRGVVEEPDFVKPQTDIQFDPLERWKGAPIFKFGFGGQTISCFPKHTPRYFAGSTRPQVKVSSGEILARPLVDKLPLPQHVETFPGPLRGKSKKKDVLTWLSTFIAELESGGSSETARINRNLPNSQQTFEEKILLWKIVRILVENDGVLDNPVALQAVNTVLLPEVHALDESTATQYKNDDQISGIYRPAGTSIKAEAVDSQIVESLRKLLLRGKREDAIWHAVDNRLWSHAMLIASTMGKELWRQVTHEFVRQEVKTIGTNAESLCALYEIFGGTIEDSIDQLVPPSARAGLQMVSRADTAGPAKNALDGLNRWKETLSLVLNNRTAEDQRALGTLARLLSDYGRTEAAHICYLFARNPALPSIFGGADEPHACVVLLGADHVHRPFDFSNDLDSILLTEVYEFAASLNSNSAPAPMPHLAVYKLRRANELTETGHKAEAQAYCDFIASGLKSNTKQSLYYHSLLLGEVEDLSNRLKQIPVQSSSWMQKPSIEKVSGSVWNKLNNFITGDEGSDTKSVRDPAEVGPFAGVSGSPGLSRSGSQTDLHGGYPSMISAAAPPLTGPGSRYAPNGLHSTRSSTELARSRASFEKSPPPTSQSNDARNLYAPSTHHSLYSPLGVSPPVNSYAPAQTSYTPVTSQEVPHATAQPGYTPYIEPDLSQSTSFLQDSYVPSVQAEPVESYTQQIGVSENTSHQPAFGGYAPPQPELETVAEEMSGYEPTQASYGGYEPPADTGYQPYVPDPDAEDGEDAKPKSKKKSFMDDDEDDFSNVPKGGAQMPPSQSSTDEAAKKRANDAAADAAFRAAAEDDARRAKEAAEAKKAGGSWLGGWFGGKKSDSLDGGSSKAESGNKATQIKFGEKKMKLYYDKELGKWVNPDNPDSSKPKATPPPPRSNAGTPASIGGPPMGGPPRSTPIPSQQQLSRTQTPVSEDAQDSRPNSSQINAMLPPSVNQSLGLGSSGKIGPPTGASSAPTPNPPSRPSSTVSSVSGLDDLLGGPPTGARKGPAGRGAKAKKGRYVDVMAK